MLNFKIWPEVETSCKPDQVVDAFVGVIRNLYRRQGMTLIWKVAGILVESGRDLGLDFDLWRGPYSNKFDRIPKRGEEEGGTRSILDILW